MNKLFSLIKANLLTSYSIYGKVKSKHRIPSFLIGFIIIVFYIVIIYGIYRLLKILLPVFRDSATPELLYAVVIASSSVFTLIKAYINANNYIFKTSDYNRLICMPIEPKIIVASKVISLYINIMTNVLIQLIPIYILYLQMYDFSFIFLLEYIVFMLLLPLLPMSIGVLISFLIGLAPLKTLYKKIASSSFFIIIGGLLAYQFITIISKTYGKTIDVDYIVDWFYKFNLFGKIGFIGFFDKKIWLFFIFIVASLICTFGLIIVVASFYKYYNNIQNFSNKNKSESHKKKNKELSFNENKSTLSVLIKKDLILSFKLPSYIVNVIVGPILALVLICVIVFSSELRIIFGKFFASLFIEYRYHNNVLFFLCLIIILLNYSMTTTSSAFSIEGRYKDIIKSMPIPAYKVFLSKILVNIITAIPLLIITGTILYLKLKVDMNIVIFGYLTVLLYIINISIIGLYYDIKYPRISSSNMTKNVNKGNAVTFTTIFSFVVIAFEVFVGYCMFIILPNLEVIRYEFIVNIAFFILSLWLLIGKGYPKYKTMNR